MKVTFGILSRNRPKTVVKLVNNIKETVKKIEYDILIIDDKSANENRLRFNDELKDPNVFILDMPVKSSCSRLFNLLMMFSNNRYVVIMNDDMKLLDNWEEAFINTINLGHEYILFLNHGLFLIDLLNIHKVGFFDENFLGGGYEDMDMLTRIRLSEKNSANKIKFLNASAALSDRLTHEKKEEKENASWRHCNGSTYYAKKWGADYYPINVNQEPMLENLSTFEPYLKTFKQKFKKNKKIIKDSILSKPAAKQKNGQVVIAVKCVLECYHTKKFVCEVIPDEVVCEECSKINEQ
tara:strand:- start:22920 stop:23804 length:885 start_codon:yes stop_codon:yes gene_type:complete